MVMSLWPTCLAHPLGYISYGGKFVFSVHFRLNFFFRFVLYLHPSYRWGRQKHYAFGLSVRLWCVWKCERYGVLAEAFFDPISVDF